MRQKCNLYLKIYLGLLRQECFLMSQGEFQSSGHIGATATAVCSPASAWRRWQLIKPETPPKLSNTSWICTQLNQDSVG